MSRKGERIYSNAKQYTWDQIKAGFVLARGQHIESVERGQSEAMSDER
jgi:hypothetical protein